MAQPADFYQGKYDALKEWQHDLVRIIDKVEDQKWYENKVADNPDLVAGILLVQNLRREIRRLDLPLANVERKMHEKE